MAVPGLRRKLPGERILVDYRDLLSGNFWRESSRKGKRRRLREREERALAASDALFVNTDEAKRRFHEVVKTPAGFPVQVMRNAADYALARDIAGQAPPPSLGDGVHIGYFGTIFEQRPLTPILDGLNALEPGLASRFRFHLYVPPNSRRGMEAECARTGGQAVDCIEYHDLLPYAEALRTMQAMDALVLVNGATPEDRIFVPGKLYDYLMACRPVLFVGGVGDAWNIVAECCGESWCSRHAEPERLAGTLRLLAGGRPPDVAPNDAYRPEASFKPLLDMLDAD
jgi:hypothetical protein